MIDKLTYIETENEKYPVMFSINVFEAIQDQYGSFDNWVKEIEKEEPNVKALKFALTEAINEGIDIENEKLNEKRPFLTTKQVGRILTEVGIDGATGAIQTSLSVGYDGEKEDSKN